MSRAVIDQAGIRICFIGLVLSLVIGLAIKTQIAPKRIETLLQESVSRLEKDFIIDFKSAEVRLSKWGLPLPYLEISQIRMSPKKASCQDTQIYVENLNVPLSIFSLITSKSLITELHVTSVELRVAELKGCIVAEERKSTSKVKSEVAHHVATKAPVMAGAQAEEQKSIFKVRTSGLLNRIRIDQLKVIYKNYPSQALDFRQVQIDLGYQEKQLDKILVNSKIYALRDPQSSVLFFRGDLTLSLLSRANQNIEAEAKLSGLFFDGTVQAYAMFNSVDQNLKLDYTVSNVAVKPLVQLHLIESKLLNYPVAFTFNGYSQHNFGGDPFHFLNFKNVEIIGEKTLVRLPSLQLEKSGKMTSIQPFEAEIQKLNLNKLANLDQLKSIAPSIENFGDMSGHFKFKNFESMSFDGRLSGLEFIFSNRGRREIQKLDSFSLEGNLERDVISIKVNEFVVDAKNMAGSATIKHSIKSSSTEAEAQLSGQLLNEKVWLLLTQVSQAPEIKLHWNFKKNEEERHQLYFYADAIESHGVKIVQPEIQMLQNYDDGKSKALAVSAKANAIRITPESLKIESLTQIFNPTTTLSDKSYTAENVLVSLKGPDWKSMAFEMDGKLRSDTDLKDVFVAKARGDWKQEDSVEGLLSFQSTSLTKKFNLVKKTNSPFTAISTD